MATTHVDCPCEECEADRLYERIVRFREDDGYRSFTVISPDHPFWRFEDVEHGVWVVGIDEECFSASTRVEVFRQAVEGLLIP